MKAGLLALALAAAASVAHAQSNSLTVFQDPNCGCCTGWVQHMRESGFDVKAIKTSHMAAVKQKLGVPVELTSCHTAVIEGTGQVVEGHVPASAVRKLLATPAVSGVAAPGMPLNSPGMGEMDGNLVTLDFQGRPFSRD